MKAWIIAARLRTLPLALSCIGMGGILAAIHHQFDAGIFLLAVITTLFLQILSNFANDYGDTLHGADSEHRLGPSRMVQSGKIKAFQMRNAMGIMALLSLVSGIGLLVVSFPNDWWKAFIFLLLGLMAIAAAIFYTAGSRPYGYAGYGDLFVFLFFGWVGVLGTKFLMTHHLETADALPASMCGFLATGVLNLNNIRDIASDKLSGKQSIPVRLGRKRAVYYHIFLLAAGFLCGVFYFLYYPAGWKVLFVLPVVPLLIINVMAVRYRSEPGQLDPYLRQLALSTMLYVLLFGVAQLL